MWRSAGFQTCCIADFQIGRGFFPLEGPNDWKIPWAKTRCRFGNLRYSTYGNLRYDDRRKKLHPFCPLDNGRVLCLDSVKMACNAKQLVATWIAVILFLVALLSAPWEVSEDYSRTRFDSNSYTLHSPPWMPPEDVKGELRLNVKLLSIESLAIGIVYGAVWLTLRTKEDREGRVASSGTIWVRDPRPGRIL